MARTRINWSLYAGDRNEKTVQVLRDGDGWDLTGATVAAQARRTANDPVVALTATVTPVDPAQGIFTISWDGNAVRALLAGEETWKGVWDLDILPAGGQDGSSETVADGEVVARMDVTKAPDVVTLPVPDEPVGPVQPIPPEPQPQPQPKGG